MSFYALPPIILSDIDKKINIIFSNIENGCAINPMLNNYLNTIKLQINKYLDKWNIYKKYTNPYEYIHSSTSNHKNAICKYIPLSRSFFKMIEICHLHKILHFLPINNCKTFHMAEGPGGFIEAILFLRKNTNDKYYGMTLQSEESEIPGWKKSASFLKNNDNIYIENGIDNTGNLLSKENFIYCNNTYKNSMDLITGDGGFDFSADFMNQEGNSIKLIYSQVCFALSMQKIGGCFIIKMFDLFTQISIDILFLLANYYKSVNIMKPNTSRYANSEKYIICKGFYRELSDTTINKIIDSYDNINSEDILKKIINIDIPYFFINKLEEINAIFGQQQIENIAHTISLIEKHSSYKIDNIKREHFIKCINWCIKFNMPYNIQKTNNIFIYNKLLLKQDQYLCK